MNHKTESSIACLGDPAGEQALVVAAKNGDEQAFETFFKRHQQKVLRVVLRYTRVREDAEDIVQQSFQKAFMHLRKFEGRSSFSTWLTRIAVNEALMFLRSIGAVREIPIDDMGMGSAASSTNTNASLVLDIYDPATKQLVWTAGQTKPLPSLDRPVAGLTYQSVSTIRQFKHSRNADGSLNSICLRCMLPVASADDELKLLEFEDRHVCNG